jgi:hypothetical protein
MIIRAPGPLYLLGGSNESSWVFYLAVESILVSSACLPITGLPSTLGIVAMTAIDFGLGLVGIGFARRRQSEDLVILSQSIAANGLHSDPE